MVEKLREYSEKGFAIVVFTNQHGISLKKQKDSDLMKKLGDIQQQVNVPM